MPSRLRDIRSKHPLARADVQNALAGLWLEQVHQGGHRDHAMVLAPLVPNPAVIPARHSVPTGRCSYALWSVIEFSAMGHSLAPARINARIGRGFALPS